MHARRADRTPTRPPGESIPAHPSGERVVRDAFLEPWTPTSAGAVVARPDWDSWIADLARRQHGVVCRRQLLEAGLSEAAIKHRLRCRRLHVLHPGVYAVGHVLLSPRGWWMAAVLSCGPGAVLSHVAAAALWGLVARTPSVADVLAPRSRVRRSGVRCHRVRRMPDGHRAVHDGIPCTSVARTLIDLATCVDERVLDRAIRQAVERRLFDRSTVDEILRSGRPGAAALRRAVSAVARDEGAGVRTKSELELRFLELLRVHDFVLPSTNVVVGTPWGEYEVDAFWPDLHLIVELDGWDAHQDRESFRRDHRRDADLGATGHRLLRLAWDQVVGHPSETVARLDRLVPRRARGTSDG